MFREFHEREDVGELRQSFRFAALGWRKFAFLILPIEQFGETTI
jgi:hypothetical protein